jgi:hypothetical protein
VQLRHANRINGKQRSRQKDSERWFAGTPQSGGTGHRAFQTESKILRRFGAHTSRCGQMRLTRLCAARKALAVFVAKVETGLVFVTHGRGGRGDKSNQNAHHAQPGGDNKNAHAPYQSITDAELILERFSEKRAVRMSRFQNAVQKQDSRAKNQGSKKTILTPRSFGLEKLSSNVGAPEAGALTASTGFSQITACGANAERMAPSTNCAQ